MNPLMSVTRRNTLFIGTALAAVSALGSQTLAQAPSPAEAKAIGKEAFLWGMHPVAIYHMRFNQAQNEKSPAYVGINRLRWYRKPMTAADRFATTPNATTLYGAAMLDLSKEPVVLTVPEIRSRYWSIQFVDNYARWWPLMVGNQFNAPGPLRRLLVGPNWKGGIFLPSSSGTTSCSRPQTSRSCCRALHSPTTPRRS